MLNYQRVTTMGNHHDSNHDPLSTIPAHYYPPAWNTCVKQCWSHCSSPTSLSFFLWIGSGWSDRLPPFHHHCECHQSVGLSQSWYLSDKILYIKSKLYGFVCHLWVCPCRIQFWDDLKKSCLQTSNAWVLFHSGWLMGVPAIPHKSGTTRP